MNIKRILASIVALTVLCGAALANPPVQFRARVVSASVVHPYVPQVNLLASAAVCNTVAIQQQVVNQVQYVPQVVSQIQLVPQVTQVLVQQPVYTSFAVAPVCVNSLALNTYGMVSNFAAINVNHAVGVNVRVNAMARARGGLLSRIGGIFRGRGQKAVTRTRTITRIR